MITHREIYGRIRPVCDATGKVRYSNRTDAVAALKQAFIERVLYDYQWRQERRVYRCLYCDNGWHLTSKEMPDWAREEDRREYQIY